MSLGAALILICMAVAWFLPAAVSSRAAGCRAVSHPREQPRRPKTEASDRTVALDEDTVTALRAYRKRQAAERLAAGEACIDNGFVFTDEIGRPLHPQQVSDHFYQLAFQVGLPPVRLHDLRRGAASHRRRHCHFRPSRKDLATFVRAGCATADSKNGAR